MKIAIVTDSTAFLSNELKEHKDLYILPIPIVIDNHVFYEGIDIFADHYYEKLKASENFPTTSQPSVGEMMSLYQRLEQLDYEGIINIFLSSGISGTVGTAEGLKSQYPNMKFGVVDAKITSSPMGNLVATALTMIQEKKSFEEILDRLKVLTESVGAYLLVENLHHLVKGGRLTNGAAIIGGLLKIKPILQFDKEGKIVLYEKIRSSKRASQRLTKLVKELFDEHGNHYTYYIIHGNYLPAANQLKETIEVECPGISLDIHEFGPVIGTHLGEHALGIGWAEKYQ